MPELDPPVRRPGQFSAKRDITIGVRITAEALKVLDQLAELEERSRSDMIRILLREGMEARLKRR